MKKFMIFFVFASLFFSFCVCDVTFAENERIFYAKVQGTGVNLCSTPSEASALFEIPYSYFVQVDYVVDDYYKVSYKDVEGYVKRDKVKLMSGTPQSPYANATYKLFVPYAIYQSPSQNSTKAVDLTDTTITIDYYGTINGQQVMSDNNVWYYSCATVNGQKYYGYVFSGVTDYLSQINVNSEIFDEISDDMLDSSATEFTSLSTGTKIMLIVSISVPSVLILYFLIKPSKIMQISKNKKQVKKESRKIRHGDYFEFDESDL